jgi:uridine kinase
MQALDENGKVNFDLPGALDQRKLEADLQQLVAGNPIEVKEYFFNAPPNKNVLLTIHPSEVIIVEGLFLFYYEKVFQTLDFSIFVDVDHQTQLDRRIYRDQETRGYKRSEIIYQWNHHVLPCYQNYIEPYKEEAHFIFRNDHHADEDFGHLFISLSSLTKMELQT